MQYSIVMIDETPFCFWDLDIRKKNEDFIQGYDPMYFEVVSSMMYHYLDEGNLSDKEKQYMSFGIRLLLSQITEAFFSLLTASLQSPDCIYGWLFKYRSNQLHSVINKISKDIPIKNKLKLTDISWQSISNIIHQFKLEDMEKEKSIKEKFALFWGRMAKEFQSEDFLSVYNSMKHGYRVSPGGVFVAFGLEKIPGKAVSPKDMQSLGGSKYGASHYYIDEKISDGKNIRLRQRTTNWCPRSIWEQIALLRISISNVLSFLKIYHRHDPKDVQFTWPEDLKDFDRDLQQSPGVLNVSFDFEIQERDIKKYSKNDLVELWNKTYSLD